MQQFTINSNRELLNSYEQQSNLRGKIYNSGGQQTGYINNFNQITTNFGLPTTRYVSGGFIRDSLYGNNIIGTINNVLSLLPKVELPKY